jgi:glycerol-3-phosphate dehydrogenase
MAIEVDIVVIGAGVVGAAIARDLSRLQAKVCLLEARADFGDGASKGNSAIICSGWDIAPNTLERDLVIRGYARYRVESSAMGLPFSRVGETMVAWKDEELEILREKYCDAKRDRFVVEWLSSDQLYAKHPSLGKGAHGAIHIPDEIIVDPFSTVYAYVLDAHTNGVRYLPNSSVRSAAHEKDRWILEVGDTFIQTGLVINAAGLQGDRVDRMAGFQDFTIQPRKGQFVVFDKLAASQVESIIVPTPNDTGRGVLILPTIFGNVMVGPTAEEIEDREDRSNDTKVIESLIRASNAIIPSLREYPIVTTFAGMRPATEHSEYQIINHCEEGWITVGGIRSTGLSAGLGIAEYVTDLVHHRFNPKPPGDIKPIQVPNLSVGRRRPWELGDEEEDREVVCHCELVTLGEIKTSHASVVPPQSLKALCRRTRAGYGRCQGFFCGARVRQLYGQHGKEQHHG